MPGQPFALLYVDFALCELSLLGLFLSVSSRVPGDLSTYGDSLGFNVF